MFHNGIIVDPFFISSGGLKQMAGT